MGKKNEANYFETLMGLAADSVEIAAAVSDLLDDYKAARLREKRGEIRLIGQRQEAAHRVLVQRLEREFLAPMDREDILMIAASLEAVGKAQTEVAELLYMYNVNSLKPGTCGVAQAAFECCEAVRKAAGELHNFQKPAELLRMLTQIRRDASEGKRLSTEGVHSFFCADRDASAALVWAELFRQLGRCCTACSQAADVMEIAVVKGA